MVKIILNGCGGKMGKAISEVAKSIPDLVIAAGIDKYSSILTTTYPIFSEINNCNIQADVVLDFSRPEALDDLITFATAKQLPLILCTTGYTKDQLEKITETSKSIPVFRSANMSIGVNVLNSVLKKISALLYENYDIEIVEKHHNQKVDSPSGTALLLANTIKSSIAEETNFIYGREGNSKRTPNEIGIHAVRGGSIVGDHEVIFAGQGEIIELKHTALSRDVFAVGALKACQFMNNKKPGLYNMDHIVNV